MKKQDSYDIDARWLPYKARFFSLPDYYFSSLTFPESIKEAKQTLSRLNLEIKNIDSQFSEREDQLKCEVGADRDELERKYLEWRTSASKAQRMRQSQIDIVQSFIADTYNIDFELEPTEIEDRLESVESRLYKIEEKLKSSNY